MTFKEIYEAVQNHTELLGATGLLRVKETVNEAYKMFIRRQDWKFNQKFPLSTFTLGPTTNTIVFPANFRKKIWNGLIITLPDSSNDSPLNFLNTDAFNKLYPRREDGFEEDTPVDYTAIGWDSTANNGVGGFVIEVMPWPDVAYNGKQHYYYSPPKLSADGDVPHAPPDVHHHILQIAIAIIVEKLTEQDPSPVWKRVDSEFARTIGQEVKEEDQVIHMGSPRWDGGLRWNQ